MYKEKWRSSIGFNLLTTPEDITEEIRIRVPTLDLHILRKLTKQLHLDGRLYFQALQNHLSLGVHWVAPLGDNLYFSAGNDVGYWFGILKISGFDSKAHGWLTYPNMSLGYRTKKNLLITAKAQVSLNCYYKAANGEQVYSTDSWDYNGETFTIAIEQPFYNKKHLTLAFSAINNNFYWQTWSLFYKTDRKIFYPQITVGFIL